MLPRAETGNTCKRESPEELGTALAESSEQSLQFDAQIPARRALARLDQLHDYVNTSQARPSFLKDRSYETLYEITVHCAPLDTLGNDHAQQRARSPVAADERSKMVALPASTALQRCCKVRSTSGLFRSCDQQYAGTLIPRDGRVPLLCGRGSRHGRGLFFPAALHGRWNAQRIAILGDGTSRNVDAGATRRPGCRSSGRKSWPP